MRSIGKTGEPPPDAVRRIVARANRRHAIGRAAKVAGAAVCVALIIPAVVEVADMKDAAQPGPSTSTGTPAPANWQELTGKELGDALGLTTAPDGPCGEWLVEYDEGAFCYSAADLEAAGVPATRLNQHLIAYQITGLERSPELVELIQLQEELSDLLNSHPFDVERYEEVRDRLEVLYDKVYGSPRPRHG